MIKRMEISPGKQCLKSLTVKELLEIFYHSVRAKDEMLAFEPYLKRRLTVCSGLEKMLALFVKLCDGKKQVLFKGLLKAFIFGDHGCRDGITTFTYKTVLGSYSWLYAQRSLLVGLWGPCVLLGI